MKRLIIFLIASLLFFALTLQAQVVINEVLFDPSGAGDGDANGDGTGDFKSDEFVELMNTGGAAVDIGGWTLANSTQSVMFTFPGGTTLAAGEFCVVFGGVDSAGFGSHFPASLQVFASQSGVSVGFDAGGRNNLYSSNENVILKDSSGQAIAEVYWGTATAKTAVGLKFASPNTYDGGSYSGTAIDQSVTRETDGTGLFAQHSDLPGGLLYSPGAYNTNQFALSNYCWAHGSSSATYINKFTVDGTDYTSGATTYSDFTSKTIYIAPGSETTFRIQKGDGASGYMMLWIDYNGDGDFTDMGEELFSRGPLTTYTQRTIYIPPDISIASTRLRIAAKQGTAPTSCETNFIGEVEDYTVKFASVVLNEVCFDPSGAGDANGDGTVDFRSDEFIELMNISGSTVDIGDWTLRNESDSAFFTFPTGTTLQPGELCVVFGGVDPAVGFGAQFPAGVQKFTAFQAVDRGFEAGGNNNLHSGDDNVVLRDADARAIAEVYWGPASPLTVFAEKLADPNTVDGNSYTGTDLNQSVGRLPDGTGLWAKHGYLYSGVVYSPGRLNTDAASAPQAEGFYKVLFMDGGVGLTSKISLPVADYLGITMEHIATEDTDTQTAVMISSVDDDNGRLLYPDGEPRFRAIFNNGGVSTDHGNALGEDGRNRVRTFYANGGSFTGSCAGAFIVSVSPGTTGIKEQYYHIWPGRTKGTLLFDTYTGHYIESGSPLLDYYNFGGDMYISNIYHNGGCYANTSVDYPAGTEVLLRYNYSSKIMHQEPSAWAYKEDNDSGRLCVIGSHPESVTGGEQLQLMSAMLQYALAGQGNADVKATLVNGQIRVMDKSTADNDPDYTKIGDKQYHHFTVEVPAGATNFEVILDGDTGYDFNLYVHPGTFAYASTADHKVVSTGAYKTVSISVPSAGTWYIGVECASTVVSERGTWGYEYSGDLSVLNGVEYSITASWTN